MLDAEQELLIRESLADTLATIPTIGFVQPSPLYCNEVSEFWATFDATKDTKNQIDSNALAACWIYPVGFVDVPDAGCLDKPLTQLTYEFYLFRQYGVTRESDRSMSVEIFDTEILANHNDFVAAWLGIKNEFQGKRAIAGLTGFSLADTTSVVQVDDIENRAICDFVSGIVGFSVRLRETVNLLVA